MKERNLLILGAGQFGQLVREIAESTGDFARIDFLDDQNPLAIGPLASYTEHCGEYGRAVVAIGNPQVRLAWLQKLQTAGYCLRPLVSPSAHASPSAVLGDGTVLEPMAVVQAAAVLGRGCIVSSGAVVRHNAVMDEGCHCDCNAVVLSCARVPAYTKIPCGQCRE